MVAFLGLLEHDEVFVEHLLLREGDAVDTCHLLALGIAAPESTGHTGDLDGLDGTCGNKVRTTAEIGKMSLGVC